MRLFEWIVGKSTKSECDRLKDENERLSKQIVSLLGEIQEASAYYDFETARLEKKIAELLENKESLIKTLQEPDYMRCVNNPDFTLKMTRYEKLKPQTDFVKAIDAAMTKKRGRPRKQRD
jgi:hypothetical protein